MKRNFSLIYRISLLEKKPSKKPKNLDRRTREDLTHSEVDQLRIQCQVNSKILQTKTIKSLLENLIKAEMAERMVRSINYRMSAAKFAVQRDLDRFDFSTSRVDENAIGALADRCKIK